MPYPTQPWPVILVSGEQQVYAYQMQPNTNGLFMDMQDNTVWLKTCDGMGNSPRPRAFDLVEREGDTSGDFATKGDLARIDEKMDELIGALR